MDASSLIFLLIVGLWAACLVPHWLRRREELAAARADDRFSEQLRVLDRAAEPEAHPEHHAAHSYLLPPSAVPTPAHPDRATGVAVSCGAEQAGAAPGAEGGRTSSPPLSVARSEVRRRRRARAWRRRGALLVLVLATASCGWLTWRGVTPRWLVAVPVGVLMLVMTAWAGAARGDRTHGQASPGRRTAGRPLLAAGPPEAATRAGAGRPRPSASEDETTTDALTVTPAGRDTAEATQAVRPGTRRPVPGTFFDIEESGWGTAPRRAAFDAGVPVLLSAMQPSPRPVAPPGGAPERARGASPGTAAPPASGRARRSATAASTENVGGIGAPWVPVPVPLPTYLLKSKAGNPVTISCARVPPEDKQVPGSVPPRRVVGR